MWTESCLLLLLRTVICAGAMAEAKGSESSPGTAGGWEGVVVQTEYELEYGNVEMLLSSAERLRDRALKHLFRHVRWKPGVQVFQTSQRGRIVRLARLGQQICRLTRHSLGYFVEEIDSKEKAMEIAMYFHQGVLLPEECDTRAVIRACRDSKAGEVICEPGGSLRPESAFDTGKKVYRVAFVIYEDRKVTRARYLVTPEGLIGFAAEVIVEGPRIVAGWDSPNERMQAYTRRVQAFENAVEKPVAAAALKLLNEEGLARRGLLRASDNALRWLLEDRCRLELHAICVQQFIASDDGTVDETLKSQAISKLRALGKGIGRGTP